MNALTWSPNLYQAVKNCKQSAGLADKAALSAFALNAKELAAAVKVLVQKQTSELGVEWT